MGLLTRLFSFGRPETRAMTGTPHDFLPYTVGVSGGGGFNDSGVPVTEANAITCSAVWACVNIIAQAVAALPVQVISKADSTQLPDHPVAAVIGSVPNEYQTPAAFRETLLANALLWGFGTAYIDRDEMGEPVGLYPLRSAVTRPIRTPAGELVYQTIVGSRAFYLTPDQVFYLPGLSIDGITALSPVMSARQEIGTAVAMSRYAAKVFGSGGNVGGILKTPPMKEDALKNFVASWRANYAGIENSLKVAVLPDGYDFKPTTLDPEKGQMTQARQSQVLDIARFYRVPPHMLGIMDKASYASIEQVSLDFYQNTVAPWINKFEQEADRKLLLEREKTSHTVKLDMDAMLRADTAARYSAYNTGRQGGWLSINDIRRKEGLPPVEGGDALLQPLNMTPVNQPAATPTATPAPAKPDPLAARSLIEDAARRVLTKESRALQRAAKKYAGKPDELRAWSADFYNRHQALVARTFAAPLKGAGATIGPDDYAKRHVAASLADLARAIDQRETVDDLADEWETIRPANVAAELMET